MPANARVRDFGGGRRGVEIDGNNAPNPTGLTQRIALTQGETRSIRTSVLVMSSLVSQPNGYEGIGCDVKWLIRNGLSTTPLVTYSRAPFKSGDPSMLYNEQYAEPTVLQEIIRVPYGIPVEFIDVTWGVRGSSGQVKFLSASLRNHYQDRYETNVGASYWTEFSTQTINLTSQSNIQADIRYLDAYAVKVPKYADITVKFDSFLNGAGWRDLVSVPRKAILSVGLKMRRKDGGYDWWSAIISNPEVDGSASLELDFPVSISPSFVAQNEYTQFEPVIMATLPNFAPQFSEITSRYLSHNGIGITVLVNDPVNSGAVI